MLAALVAVGCGSSGSETGPRHATTTRPTTSVTGSTTTFDQEAADKAEITATFNGWVKLYNRLKQSDNDWNDPRMEDFLAGDALKWSRSVLRDRKVKGETSRPSVPSNAHSSVENIRIDGDIATVSTCEVNDSVLIARDGSVIDDRAVTYFDETVWHRINGQWRMWAGISEHQSAGVKECD